MTQGLLLVDNVSEECTDEQILADISEASFIQFRGCFNVCADFGKHVQRQASSGPTTRTFQGRLPSSMMEVHPPSDKRECEEEMVHKLLLLAGDVETNPGPLVRL